MSDTVLRGDSDITKAQIDSIDREWKFTAGVGHYGTGDYRRVEKYLAEQR